jgi:hypothetical protein
MNLRPAGVHLACSRRVSDPCHGIREYPFDEDRVVGLPWLELRRKKRLGTIMPVRSDSCHGEVA